MGILIAVEGMDGSGKSTQADLLYHWLRSKGLPVHHTEWNSSPSVKKATKVGKDSRRLLPRTFHLIHAADFADRWSRQIEPVLEVGGIVICDRYIFTAMARDGAREVPRDVIEATYAFAREPDITLYFDIPVEVGLERILKGRPELKYYEAGMDMQWTYDPLESYKILQTKIKDIYDVLADDGRMLRIDSTGGVSEVQKRVRKVLAEKLDFSNIEPIYPADRLAEQYRGSRLEWLDDMTEVIDDDDS
jgi:dTMP kinase